MVTGDTKRPDTNNLITTNVGKQVNYTFDEKEITIPKDLCGLEEAQKYTPKNADTAWYVWYEDNEDVYLVGICKTQLSLKGFVGYNNGVGVIRAVCDSGFRNINFPNALPRSIEPSDLNLPNTCPDRNFNLGTITNYWPNIDETLEITSSYPLWNQVWSKQDLWVSGTYTNPSSKRSVNGLYQGLGTINLSSMGLQRRSPL